MFRPIYFTALMYVCFLGSQFCTSMAFSGYGEVCNKTVRCEPSGYLNCQNETCACVKPESMMYDENLHQCVALVGEKCRYTVANTADSVWYETVGCVQFAICTGDLGICTCLPNFVDHKNGTCSERGGFGAECQERTDCRSDLALSCMNGTCRCDPEKSVDSLLATGNNLTRACLGLAGKPCLHHKCTLNAHCPEIYFPPEHRPLCQCIPPYAPTPGGLCLAGHGYPCSTLNPCAEGFTCVDQRCACQHPFHQIFDQYTGTCKSLVWGPCNQTDSDDGNQIGAENQRTDGVIPIKSQCVDGATCVKSKLDGFTHCECEKDFIENDQGECDLGFGTSCEVAMFRKCDQIARLSCRSGKCDCVDDLQMYDPATRKCKGLVGSVCTTSDSCTDKAACEFNMDSFGRLGGRRTCVCANETQPTGDRTCT